MIEIAWYVLSISHIFSHPDTAYLSLKQLGYGDLKIITIILALSTSFGAIQYAGCHFGFRWTSKTKRGLAILDCVKERCTNLICGLGYLGIIIAPMIPVPGTRALAFSGGKILRLKYVLPVVLAVSILRIFILFQAYLSLIK
ncbi:MAG: hypothetical protein Q7R92_05550 [bacterium]|nr:hypothetical protein [bacterium]